MIVDDSWTVRHQLRTLLEGRSYAVVEAASGVEGLSKARDQAFDLIISDVNMPGMSGIDMVREVRHLAAHTRTPIFVLTTESSTELARRGKEAGVTAWIVKPFKPELLLKGIEKVTSS
jgi:two-component system, chemotaxis family, chemotaxis protein CheY